MIINFEVIFKYQNIFVTYVKVVVVGGLNNGRTQKDDSCLFGNEWIQESIEN